MGGRLGYNRCRVADSESGQTSRGSGDEAPTLVVGRRDAPPQPLDTGTELGRYVVLEAIGSGGMGEVFRAYDPKLRREVALKRLRSGALDPEAEARLLREAQAMAQLSHPSVVPVFDVDRTEHGVIMAMEFVDGETLAQWLKSAPPRSEVVARFVAAGRALEAAHAAGLVHRDFKPGNVMCGRDGRVRVLDFGLARALQSEGEIGGGADEPPTAPDADEGDSLSSPLTQQGAVMGTPAYMAPEQHIGQPATARSDQYAFCAALWEGLVGHRAFSGPLVRVVLAKRDGPPAMPSKAKVPSWIQAIVARGMAPEADARWPSMTDLLAALSRDPVRTRRQWIVVGAAAIALVGAGAAISRVSGEADDPCPNAAAAIADVWSPERRAQVHEALASRPEPYAARVAEQVTTQIDDYVAGWIAMKNDACQGTRVRGDQSAELLDLRTACLRRRHSALAATVEVLAAPDDAVVERAPEIADALPPLAPCADAEGLRAAVPPPDTPELAQQVEALRADNDRATAISDAGKYAEAAPDYEPLVERARALDYPLVLAEVLHAKSINDQRRGDNETGRIALTEAYEIAMRLGANRLAASIAIGMGKLYGMDDAKHEIGEAWLVTGGALAERVDDDVLRASVLMVRGGIANRAGRFSEGVDDLERALALLEAAGAPASRRATTINQLGISLDELERFPEAQRRFRQAVELEESLYGADHPAVLSPLANLAISYSIEGRREDARPILERVLQSRIKLFGEGHSSTALSHVNLGWNYMDDGQAEPALPHFVQARETFVAAQGARHANVGMAAEGIGTAQLSLGNLEEAEKAYAESLDVRREALGSDHVYVALSLKSLAMVAIRRADPTKALQLLDEAEAILGPAGDNGKRFLADVHELRGDALRALDRPADAITPYENALSSWTDAVDPFKAARVRLGLAKALAATGDPSRARELAQQCRRALSESSDPERDAAQREVEAFLATLD